MKEAMAEALKEMDIIKKQEILAKWKPKVEALEEQAKKLSAEEKKKFDAALDKLGGMLKK